MSDRKTARGSAGDSERGHNSIGSPLRPDRLYDGYVIDLDGTVYLGNALLPGARQTIEQLRRAGRRLVFLTNKPLERSSDYAAKLTRLGLPTTPAEIVSSTDALLRYLGERAAGARIFPVAEPLLWELLAEAGFETTDRPERVDVVVASFDRTFDYAKLKIAFDAIRAGARLVATNPDAFCPTPDGGLPDCAAMLGAIEGCTGVRAEAIVGKPSPHMAATLLERLHVDAAETLLVGDRLATDVRMAAEAGMASALVLTGATRGSDLAASPIRPDYVLEEIGDLLPRPKPLR